MAGSIPISQLNYAPTLNLGMIVCVVDPNNITMAPTGTTEDIYLWQLVNFIFQYQGLPTFTAVVCASTTNLTASYNNNGSGVGATLTNSGTMVTLYLDSYAPQVGQRVLIKNQTNAYQNGIYTVTNVGSPTVNWVLTRSTDLDLGSQFINDAVCPVLYGITQTNTMWQLSCAATFVVGTTPDYWNLYVVPNPQLTWTDVTAVSVNALVQNGYIADRSGSAVQVQLPANFNIGDTVIVMGKGTAGWTLIANTGQTIQFGSVVTSSGGSITNDIQYGNIQVRGLVADTVWEVTSVFGNPTYM